MTDKAPITDLATLGGITGSMTRPKSLDTADRAGTEDINREDIRLPRLAIAQGLSPQVTPGDAQFVDGLKLFDMFNDLTGEVYGKGPITFVPIRRSVHRMEYRPRSEGGGLIDANVPANDPRTFGSTGDNGVWIPPVATTYVDFIVLLLRKGHEPEPIVLSIRGTNKHNRRASDTLTTLILGRNAAIYAGLYTVDTLVPAKNDKGTFGVPSIKNAGFIPVDTPAGQALYEFAKGLYEGFQGKQIEINREAPTEAAVAEEEIPF